MLHEGKLVFETLKTENLEIQLSKVGENLYQSGMWFFYEDETGALSNEYPSLGDAARALRIYVAHLNGEKLATAQPLLVEKPARLLAALKEDK